MVASAAVTFTLMALAPSDRSTSKLSVLAVSASVSASSLASKYVTVALAWLFVGVTVTRVTGYPTEAV